MYMPVNQSLYQMDNSVFHQHQSGTYSQLQRRMAPVWHMGYNFLSYLSNVKDLK